MYHVKVTGCDRRLFAENSENWYTHIDLNLALTYIYTIELIKDGEYNYLDYKQILVRGAKLFRPYIDYLLKMEG